MDVAMRWLRFVTARKDDESDRGWWTDPDQRLAKSLIVHDPHLSSGLIKLVIYVGGNENRVLELTTFYMIVKRSSIGPKERWCQVTGFSVGSF